MTVNDPDLPVRLGGDWGEIVSGIESARQSAYGAEGILHTLFVTAGDRGQGFTMRRAAIDHRHRRRSGAKAGVGRCIVLRRALCTRSYDATRVPLPITGKSRVVSVSAVLAARIDSAYGVVRVASVPDASFAGTCRLVGAA